MAIASAATRRREIVRGSGRLNKMYGRRPSDFGGKALDVLVEAFLAQHTNMANAVRGYRSLRRRFPSWTKVMLASPEAVQREIAICGLARTRAIRLQAILRRLKSEQGKLSLDALADRPAADVRVYLTSFHGIGPKTAAFVMLFAFGHPVVPIDNGVLRVIRRLRWVRQAARDVEAERVLSPLVPRGRHYELHVLLFTHAKQRCTPRNPKCDECRLLPQCPFGQRRVKHLPPTEAEPLTLTKKERERILAKFASAGLDPTGDAAKRSS